MQQQLKDFFRMGPFRNDHHPAFRCGAGVAIPLLVLLALGRFDLMIFASFGAFAGIYGRGEAHRERFRQQCQAGALLVMCMLAGALMSMAGCGPWAVVAGATVVAGAAALAAALLRLRPAGPLFQIFAFAAIASAPPAAPLGEAVLTAVLSVLLALLIGVGSRVVPARRSPWARPPRHRFSAGERRGICADALAHAAAAGAAGSIATLAGLGHNYWAMIAAVVPLAGPTAGHKVARGLHRILGTFGGLVLAALVLESEPAPWLLVVLIAVLQLGAELFVARQYTVAQLLVTPLALLMTQLSHPAEPDMLVRDRAVETVIGAAAGIVLVLLVHSWLKGRRAGAGRPPAGAPGQLPVTGPAALPATSGAEDGKCLRLQPSQCERSSASALAPRP